MQRERWSHLESVSSAACTVWGHAGLLLTRVRGNFNKVAPKTIVNSVSSSFTVFFFSFIL